MIRITVENNSAAPITVDAWQLLGAVSQRPVTRNTRTAKHAMRYDGHNRRPGVSAHNDTMKWRRIRRNVKRWLTDRMETW